MGVVSRTCYLLFLSSWSYHVLLPSSAQSAVDFKNIPTPKSASLPNSGGGSAAAKAQPGRIQIGGPPPKVVGPPGGGSTGGYPQVVQPPTPHPQQVQIPSPVPTGGQHQQPEIVHVPPQAGIGLQQQHQQHQQQYQQQPPPVQYGHDPQIPLASQYQQQPPQVQAPSGYQQPPPQGQVPSGYQQPPQQQQQQQYVGNSAPNVVAHPGHMIPVRQNEEDIAHPFIMAGDEHPEMPQHEPGMLQEWDQVMQNFTPTLLVTFKLSPGQQMHLFQDVDSEPTRLRGGWFGSAAQAEKSIIFSILDPSGDVILKKQTGEGLFDITTSKGGQYTFVLVNGSAWSSSSETRYLTFVVGAGETENLTKSELSSVEGSAQGLIKMVHDVEAQTQYVSARQKTHIDTISKLNSRTFKIAAVELGVLVVVSFAQNRIVKSMITNRRKLF